MVNTQISSQFRQEGEFKAMDEEVKEKLDQHRKLKHEIRDMWMQMKDSFGLDKVHTYEETIREKEAELGQKNEEKGQLKEWFDRTDKELNEINRNGEYEDRLSRAGEALR